MSGADTVLHFNNIVWREEGASEAAALRLVLLRTEALSVPERIKRLRVLSGNAWISLDGRDLILAAGNTFELPALKRPAVVSAAGCAAVLFELR